MANEETTITAFVRRVLKQLGPDDVMYCIFDGACRDSTMDKVKALAEDDARIQVIFDENSKGPVDAYFRGYREALDGGCEWIVEMDAGLAHLPEHIPRFFEALANGAEFAPGSRFMPGAHYYGGRFLHKHLLSRGGTFLANVLLRTRYSDLTGGFKGHTRRVLQRVVDRGVHSKAHSFQIEVRQMLDDEYWEEVPITYRGASHVIDKSIVADCLLQLGKLWRKAGKERK